MMARMTSLLPLIILGLVLAVPAWAADPSRPEECDQNFDIPVNITPRFDDPTHNFSLGISAIQVLSRERGQGISESLTLGVTRYEPMLQISMPVKGIKFPDGLICGHVEKVDVTFGYKNVRVFIANEVRQGTCGFNEIMAHEYKHIAVNQRILEAYLPHVEAKIREYIYARGVFRGETESDAMRQLKADVQSIIQNEMALLEEDNHTLQQEVDSRDEYERITYSCDGELAELTHAYLGR